MQSPSYSYLNLMMAEAETELAEIAVDIAAEIVADIAAADLAVDIAADFEVGIDSVEQ